MCRPTHKSCICWANSVHPSNLGAVAGAARAHRPLCLSSVRLQTPRARACSRAVMASPCSTVRGAGLGTETEYCVPSPGSLAVLAVLVCAVFGIRPFSRRGHNLLPGRSILHKGCLPCMPVLPIENQAYLQFWHVRAGLLDGTEGAANAPLCMRAGDEAVEEAVAACCHAELVSLDYEDRCRTGLHSTTCCLPMARFHLHAACCIIL